MTNFKSGDEDVEDGADIDEDVEDGDEDVEDVEDGDEHGDKEVEDVEDVVQEGLGTGKGSFDSKTAVDFYEELN